jgi:hypothetical protein
MTKHQDENGEQQVAEWMEGLKKPDDLIHSPLFSQVGSPKALQAASRNEASTAEAGEHHPVA